MINLVVLETQSAFQAKNLDRIIGQSDKFIPEYVTLEEIITYYFENHKIS